MHENKNDQNKVKLSEVKWRNIKYKTKYNKINQFYRKKLLQIIQCFIVYDNKLK